MFIKICMAWKMRHFVVHEFGINIKFDIIVGEFDISDIFKK